MQVLFILLFLCGYLLAFLPQPAQAVTSWYNSGWDYRKELTVYGSSSAAQTNYQKFVRVYATNVGTDIPENLAQYTTNDDSSAVIIYGASWQGQTFTAEASATVKKVWLKLGRILTPAAAYTCAIRATAAGVPSGVNLCSGTITGNYVSTTADWYEFDMGAGTPLTSGTVYAVILYSAGGDAANHIFWRGDLSAPAYTNGTRVYSADSGATWTATALHEMMFQICTTTTGTIPLRVDTEGHCQADFDDLRFTKADGTTLLDYWIENKATCTTDLYADCWVELDTIAQMTSLTEHTHFYLYYGNTTAVAVSNGSTTFVQFDNFDSYTAGTDINGQGGWTGTVAGVVVSTDHAYSSANSLKVIGSAGYNTATRVLVATSQAYWIGRRIWKEDAAAVNFIHGNGTNSLYTYINTAEAIGFIDSGGGAVATGLSITADVWKKIDRYSAIFTGTSFVVRYDNNLSATCQMYTNVIANGVVSINDAASGVGNDTYIDDYFVAKFAVSMPLWGLPGGEESVPLTVIDNAKVFMGYKETGDWLITVRYVNTYAPYYDTYDVKQYFALQLIDSSNVVKASAALPAWGNRVGSIYLSAASVTSLTYGGAYRIRMYGTFTGNPYVDYTLVADDWQGNDLTKLDTWVYTCASVIGTYYSTALTTYMAERGEVLNATGSGIFNTCIGGLSQVRPAIFQIYSNPSEYTPATIGQTYRQELKAWQTNIGPDGTTMLNNLGKIIHVGGDIISVIAFLGMVMLLMTLAYPAGTTPAACALSIPLLGAAIWFGMDWIYIGLLALVAGFLFVKNFWIDKGN
jgi:hypothetical protein